MDCKSLPQGKFHLLTVYIEGYTKVGEFLYIQHLKWQVPCEQRTDSVSRERMLQWSTQVRFILPANENAIQMLTSQLATNCLQQLNCDHLLQIIRHQNSHVTSTHSHQVWTWPNAELPTLSDSADYKINLQSFHILMNKLKNFPDYGNFVPKCVECNYQCLPDCCTQFPWIASFKYWQLC